MSHSLSCFPQTFGQDTEKELQAPAADDSASIEEAYMAVKETNEGGSRKTSAEQVPAVTWHFQSSSQFISSASWEVNT